MSINKNLSEIIDVLYGAAISPANWPNVFQSLVDSHEYLESQFNNSHHPSLKQDIPPSDINIQKLKKQYKVFSIIMPHIRRALEVNQRLVESDRNNQSLNNLISCIPISIVIIDAHKKLIAANELGHKLLLENTTFFVENGLLHSSKSEISEFLDEVIYPNNFSSHFPYTSVQAEINSSQYSILSTVFDKQGYIALFVSQDNAKHFVSTNVIKSIYNLTDAEATISKSLVEGKSLEEIAADRHKSIHTIRTQLKTILRKTKSDKQSTLVKKILTSPASYSLANKIPTTSKQNISNSQYGSITLANGRKVGYGIHGDLSGYPLVYCHSIFGSRYERPPYDSLLVQRKIKLIVIERPGFGNSDNLENLSYGQWINNLQEVMDHLGVRKFSIIGVSAGGVYASAAASLLPNRIEHLSTVSMVPPVAGIQDFGKENSKSKLIYLLAKYFP